MDLSGSHIGLTGASGMVGRQIISLIEEKGGSAIVTSRTPPKSPSASIGWKKLDLSEKMTFDVLDDLFVDVDCFIHAGASIPGHSDDLSEVEILSSNVNSTYLIGKWCAEKNIPLIFLSSCIVYEQPNKECIREEDALGANHLSGVYGLSKRLAEKTLIDCQYAGLKLTTLRLSSVYGPGMPDSKFLPQTLLRACGGGVTQFSNNLINMIHTSDVAKACFSALEFDAQGTFNLGASRCCSIGELVDCCVKVVGQGRAEELENADKLSRLYDVDISKAQEAFGFESQMGLDEGVKSVLDWLAEQNVNYMQ